MNTAVELTAELCRRFEGYKSTPYLCPAGIPTIGYGSTYYANGRAVTLQDPPISQADADALLTINLSANFGPGVLKYCPNLVYESPEKLAAIMDFAYNLGLGRLKASTLRRKVNEGRWDDACEELRKWVMGGGNKLPGLVLRREAEVALIKR